MKRRLIALIVSVVVALITVAVAIIIPISFAKYSAVSSTIWLFISDTGGVFGVPIISVLFCLLIGHYFKGWRKKMISISISLIILSILLGGLAKLNEHVIKESLKIKRPYAYYLEDIYNFDINAFYAFELKSERSEYLKTFLQQNAVHKEHNQRILDHWVVESGYSFPSGHSVNAFFMATILAYVLLFIYADYKRRMLFILVLAWAIGVAYSRVMVGAHTALDVTLGAVMGFGFGLIVIFTGIIDKLMKQKTM